MKVYESGLALLDTEIRTEVTLIYGWTHQLGHDHRQAAVDTLPIRTTDELIYSEYPCFTGCVAGRAKYPEMP